MTKDGNDWFWDQDYILPNSITTEKFTNPTNSLLWFRFGHSGNIGCVVLNPGIQNQIHFWLKLNRFLCFVTEIVLTYCEKNCFRDREKLLKF